MTLRRSLAALWTLAVLVGCLLPGDAIREFDLLSRDKLYHFVAFAGYALLWRRAGGSTRAVLITGLAFAVLIEIAQASLPIGRFADPFDTLADAVGLGVGLWISHVVERRRAGHEQRSAG